MSTRKFGIVEFEELNGEVPLEIVPISWLDQEKKSCSWPPCSGGRLKKLIKDGALPLDSWKMDPYVRIKKQFDSFGEVSKQLPKALLTSNLESAEEVVDKNTRRRRQKGKNLVSQNTHFASAISSNHQSSSDEEDRSLSIPHHTPPGDLHSSEGGSSQVHNLIQNKDLVAETRNDILPQNELLIVTSVEFQELRKALDGYQTTCFKLIEQQAQELKEIKAALINLKLNRDGEIETDFSSIPTLPIDDEQQILRATFDD